MAEGAEVAADGAEPVGVAADVATAPDGKCRSGDSESVISRPSASLRTAAWRRPLGGGRLARHRFERPHVCRDQKNSSEGSSRVSTRKMYYTNRVRGHRMTERKTYTTRTGKVLTDADIELIADEVEQGDYDVEVLMSGRRPRGRPMIGDAPSEVVPVRLDPALRQAVEARAESDHTTASDIIRRALKRFLEVA